MNSATIFMLSVLFISLVRSTKRSPQLSAKKLTVAKVSSLPVLTTKDMKLMPWVHTLTLYKPEDCKTPTDTFNYALPLGRCATNGLGQKSVSTCLRNNVVLHCMFGFDENPANCDGQEMECITFENGKTTSWDYVAGGEQKQACGKITWTKGACIDDTVVDDLPLHDDHDDDSADGICDTAPAKECLKRCSSCVPEKFGGPCAEGDTCVDANKAPCDKCEDECSTYGDCFQDTVVDVCETAPAKECLETCSSCVPEELGGQCAKEDKCVDANKAPCDECVEKCNTYLDCYQDAVIDYLESEICGTEPAQECLERCTSCLPEELGGQCAGDPKECVDAKETPCDPGCNSCLTYIDCFEAALGICETAPAQECLERCGTNYPSCVPEELGGPCAEADQCVDANKDPCDPDCSSCNHYIHCFEDKAVLIGRLLDSDLFAN